MTSESGPADGQLTGSPAVGGPAVGGPLAGVRVLDLTSVVMGPLATQILGDLGADVITVESRDGDINRTMTRGPVRGLSGVALNLLRNKRNVSIDVAHPDGRAALLRVAAGCDVFVTNLRPASLSRLRLDYPDVAGVRPDVIYCQANGFPSDSAEANKPAFDDIIQAASGVPEVMQLAGLPPALIPMLLADKVIGLVVAYAIIAALFYRERTGRGQRVEVPMADAMRAFVLVEHGGAAISGNGSAGYPRVLTPLRATLATADGWIAVQPHRDQHWQALVQTAGLDDLADDPRLTNRGLWRDPEFSASPASVRRPAPQAGEHTAELLAEAGLTEAEITSLAEAGVLPLAC
jgi:crotonobetainyl-CoA:carnitine CoA-transferase CaiB-like acyl-CoA transferase